jgi:hypothetical protein
MRKILFATIVMTFVQVHASEDLSSYEQIVRELTSPSTTSTRYNTKNSGLETIRIHASVGATATRVNLKLPAGLPAGASLGGAEVVLGIDLFSPRWIAEGAVRSFSQESFADSDISLKEFDLRIMHQVPIWEKFDLRWGGGMSARYLKFSNSFANASEVGLEYTTPASVFILGAQTKFNHAVGITAELAYRSRLISDTVDRNSFDGSVRISGSF